MAPHCHPSEAPAPYLACSPFTTQALPVSPASSPHTRLVILSPEFHLRLTCPLPSFSPSQSLAVHHHHLEGWLKYWLWPLGEFDLGLRWGARISNKSPGDSDAAVPGATLYQPLPWQWQESTSSSVYRPTDHVTSHGTESPTQQKTPESKENWDGRLPYLYENLSQVAAHGIFTATVK